MKRMLKQPYGKMKEGGVYDLPRMVWNKIREEIGVQSLDSFSKAVDTGRNFRQKSDSLLKKGKKAEVLK
jgi:hypothetical protein